MLLPTISFYVCCWNIMLLWMMLDVVVLMLREYCHWSYHHHCVDCSDCLWHRDDIRHCHSRHCVSVLVVADDDDSRVQHPPPHHRQDRDTSHSMTFPPTTWTWIAPYYSSLLVVGNELLNPVWGQNAPSNLHFHHDRHLEIGLECFECCFVSYSHASRSLLMWH